MVSIFYKTLNITLTVPLKIRKLEPVLRAASAFNNPCNQNGITLSKVRQYNTFKKTI